MGPGSILVGLGLLLLSLTAIIRPWRAGAGNDGLRENVGRRLDARAETPRGATAVTEGLIARRDAVYGALADLDFDRSVGKLNDQDYEFVRLQLMAQAVEVLKELDTSSARRASIESQVEELVRTRRSSASARGARIQGGALLGATNVYCTGCGSALRPDDHFCGKCGTPAAARCPQCDAAVGAGDAFCIRCGTALLAGAAA